jgi:hypothetical protein
MSPPSAAVEPKQVVLAVSAMIDAAAAARVTETIRALDPNAAVTVSLPGGLVAVRTTAPVEALCRALAAQGFDAEPSERPLPLYTAGRVMPVVGRALAWGLGWSILAPLAAFLLMLVFVLVDPSCNSPGDSGGCYMGLATVPVAAIVPGALGGFLVTLIRGLLRIRRTPAPG